MQEVMPRPAVNKVVLGTLAVHESSAPSVVDPPKAKRPKLTRPSSTDQGFLKKTFLSTVYFIKNDYFWKLIFYLIFFVSYLFRYSCYLRQHWKELKNRTIANEIILEFDQKQQ